MCKTTDKPEARPDVVCTELLGSLLELVEKWRTERDFLATGEGTDRTAARLYDECASDLMEIIKPNATLQGSPEAQRKEIP